MPSDILGAEVIEEDRATGKRDRANGGAAGHAIAGSASGRLGEGAAAVIRALRAVAILIAIAGAIDPAVAVTRLQPVRVEFTTPSSRLALAVRDRLMRELGGAIAVDTGDTADALVILGTPRRGATVSVVSRAPPNARNVRLIAASAPDAVLVGQDAIVTAEFEAFAMAGESSTIELEQDGIRLAATDHRWTSERERFTATLHYAPPTAGLVKVTVAARSKTREATDEDNVADLPLRAAAKTLRVAIYEARPSWAAGFVRRALESDPLFATASLVRPSRGPVVTAGVRLPALSATALADFDAVVVGAPEELTATEVAALTTFCESRGGSVVFLPDRMPSGPYAVLVSSDGFDEALLEKPLALAGGGPIDLRASELAWPRRLHPGAAVIARTTQESARAVIIALPLGGGRMLFSGALDAWRFRGTGADDEAFASFWTGVIANLASSSPPPVSITVTPAVAAPGERLTVHVAMDALAFQTSPGGEEPLVGASLVAHDGTEHFVRLWPSAEDGVFEGEAVAPSSGRYDARATVGGRVADTTIIIENGIRHPPAYDDDALRMIAATTGGVVVDATDTAGLERHLRGLGRRHQPRAAHPMRAAWWILPFTIALCGEWAQRRRRGAR